MEMRLSEKYDWKMFVHHDSVILLNANQRTDCLYDCVVKIFFFSREERALHRRSTQRSSGDAEKCEHEFTGRRKHAARTYSAAQFSLSKIKKTSVRRL